MITWSLTSCTGERYTLPTPLQWQLNYALGSPCDSFFVRFLWTAGQEDILSDAMRMTVTDGSKICFVGIIDECECRWSEDGAIAEISGRGLQGLLLDNQAEAVDYGQATLWDILRHYVTPYGIELEGAATLPPVWGFSVPSGNSCWKVLYQFARYYGGVSPRFNQKGKLVLSPLPNNTAIDLQKKGTMMQLLLREKRYAVLSKVTIKDATGWQRETAENTDFKKRGGCSSRVILLPKNTGYQARRYRATYQLKRSAERLREVEVTIDCAFAAFPGELVQIKKASWRQDGIYRVMETQVSLTENGIQTLLILVGRDAVS